MHHISLAENWFYAVSIFDTFDLFSCGIAENTSSTCLVGYVIFQMIVITLSVIHR